MRAKRLSDALARSEELDEYAICRVRPNRLAKRRYKRLLCCARHAVIRFWTPLVVGNMSGLKEQILPCHSCPSITLDNVRRKSDPEYWVAYLGS